MSTKHAILGLLSQRPMHGYELKFENDVPGKGNEGRCKERMEL